MFVSRYLTEAKIETRDDFPYFSYDFQDITGVSTLNLFNFFPTIILYTAHYPLVIFSFTYYWLQISPVSAPSVVKIILSDTESQREIYAEGKILAPWSPHLYSCFVCLKEI